MSSLEIRHVSFSYLDGLVLRDIDLLVKAGERVGLLGPNGSGKTTLLKLASGLLRPTRGEIYLGDADLRQLTRRQVAQKVAVVPQQLRMPFAFSVREMVMLGRTPFVRALSSEGEADRRAVRQAMELTNTEALGNRTFNELSGGERQKVILAMALAQDPKLLLLDEPTVHLDVNHQVEILELIKALNLEKGITIIAAMHDLNLAALYFDRLILLKEGSIFANGPPAEVLTEDVIRQVYAAPVLVRQHPSADVPNVTIIPRQEA